MSVVDSWKINGEKRAGKMRKAQAIVKGQTSSLFTILFLRT
jgi:hypothetical protein